MADEPRPEQRVATSDEVSLEELQLAARNHGMPLEGLRYPITPLGMHYLLTHFDIPAAEEATWVLEIGGHVRQPRTLTMDEVRSLPPVTVPVTMECAGNGRARLQPRPMSQPWLNEAVGTAEWTGTPLRPLIEEAGLQEDAVELVFTGSDHGTQGGIEQDYERSLSVNDAALDDALLVYEVNGQPLPPQHGYPLRLLVPGWYGMASVKWLRAITVVNEPFAGVQQQKVYRLTQTADDPGSPVTRKSVRALMQPPGIPDLFTRHRFLPTGSHVLNGMAWSGWGPIARVEVSVDGGANWADATLDKPVSPYAWTPWRFSWNGASAGEYELVTRGTDAAGNVQPLDPYWTYQGMAQNGVQRIALTVA